MHREFRPLCGSRVDVAVVECNDIGFVQGAEMSDVIVNLLKVVYLICDVAPEAGYVSVPSKYIVQVQSNQRTGSSRCQGSSTSQDAC